MKTTTYYYSIFGLESLRLIIRPRYYSQIWMESFVAHLGTTHNQKGNFSIFYDICIMFDVNAVLM